MASELKTVKKTSFNTSTSIREESKKEIPKGAVIVSQDVRTETEEIENGWLVSKSYDVRYKVSKDSEHTEYAYFTKKWYSETDPLTITVNDEALADAFKE